MYKLHKPYSSGLRSSFFCERMINVWNSLPADVDFSSVNTIKTVLSVLILPSFLDGVCNLCVCVFLFFFRSAVRAFSLACLADYCFISHRIYCHFWQINVNVWMWAWDNSALFPGDRIQLIVTCTERPSFSTTLWAWHGTSRGFVCDT